MPHEPNLLGPTDKCTTAYLENILVFSTDVDERLQHLWLVFEWLRNEKFMAKQQKYRFGKTCIKYFGHVIENEMVYTDPDKASVVQTWPKPKNVKKLQQFMELSNYYAQYIHNFADIAAPHTSLISPKQQWV